MEVGRFNEVLNELRAKRDELMRHSEQFRSFTEKYPNDTALTGVTRMLESYALITRDAFTQIETLYRANSTLKIQIDILKDILLSIPDIRDNKEFRQKIQKEFDQRHSVWHGTTG